MREYEGESTHYTHSYLWNAAHWALSQTPTDDSNMRYGGLLAIIAGAHAVEAFLNYLGPRAVSSWGRQEEWSRPTDKLKTICTSIQYEIDYDRRDYLALLQLFRLRNKLAQGRPDKVTGNWVQDDWQVEKRAELEADWLLSARKQQAFELLGLVHDLLVEIGKRAGDAEDSDEYEPFMYLAATRHQPRTEPPVA